MAAYCRVSTGSEEQQTSYQAQIQHYEKYILEHPDYFYAGVYADEGISGTALKKRDAFNQMMQDARAGRINNIITKSLSRFGRNTIDCLNSIRELKSIGVDVFFEKENIHTMRSEGEMLITLISAVAQSESQALSENVKWGIRRKYERGNIKSIPSGKFLGYTKDDEGNLIVDEAQAKIVRRIYQDFLDGQGTYQIALRLTTEQIPMAYGGKEWCPSHIRKVLTNEKFKGDTRFLKTYNTCYLTKKRAKNLGEFPQHYVENTHPAIVDRETWELVQLEFARQEKYVKDHQLNKYHQNNDKYPLSGRIFCASCGHNFIRQGKKDTLFRCIESIHGQCSFKKRIRELAPEEAFIRAWNQLVDDQTKLETDSEDILTQYRIRELRKLLYENGKIDQAPFELVAKTLERIEIDREGKMIIIFLAGPEVRVDQIYAIMKNIPHGTRQIDQKPWMTQLRMRQGLTQQQLGDLVGVRYTHILNIESGRKKPSKALAMRLGEVLGVPCTSWEV